MQLDESTQHSCDEANVKLYGYQLHTVPFNSEAEIMDLLASVRPSVCLCALLFEPFDL